MRSLTSPSRFVPPDTQAPKWTLRVVLLSGGITLGIYLLIPFMGSFSRPPEPDLTLRSLDTMLPPPVKEPPPVAPSTSQPVPLRVPQLEVPQPQLAQLPVSIDLDAPELRLPLTQDVSFNVRSDELINTMEQITFEVGELDEPPRPLARLAPVYPPRARMRRQEGYVVVEFVVDPSGTVNEVDVVESEPGDLFSAAAMQAVRQWNFEPGMKSGEAVSSRVRQRLTFTLR